MANISKFQKKRSFQDKSCAWIKDNRQSLQKNAWLFKQKLTLPKYQRYSNPFVIKELRKSDKLSPKSFLWTSKQPFAIHFFLASCNVCPVAIPEISAQTQGSDHWQLIHSVPENPRTADIQRVRVSRLLSETHRQYVTGETF